MRLRQLVLSVVLAAALTGCMEHRWYKGNTHTHTWWSDGDSAPEVVTAWYRQHGYNFLVLSDHNVLSEGDKWIEAKGPREKAAARLEEKFPGQARRREVDGKVQYRCTPLAEVRTLFEKDGEFLMIPGEEISDHWSDPGAKKNRPVHVGAVNLQTVIKPPGGVTATQVMQNNVNAVLAQRKATGQPMFAHINHPNFGWGIMAEDLAPLRGEQFFEVFNGHPGVRNWGDDVHPSTDRMWDIVLTQRLADLDLPVMFGVATDDAHAFVGIPSRASNPGRGWVMVKASGLTPRHIIAAMERGDFYATSGVELATVKASSSRYEIEIKPREGVEYTIQFIGTRRGYDRGVQRVPTSLPGEGPYVQYKYSPELGQVLSQSTGTKAVYKMTGDELYVRAKITSTAKHPNPFAEGDVEMAWTQPGEPGGWQLFR